MRTKKSLCHGLTLRQCPRILRYRSIANQVLIAPHNHSLSIIGSISTVPLCMDLLLAPLQSLVNSVAMKV